MNAYDRFEWQWAVLADGRLRHASKVVASALALIGDSTGLASVGIPQLAARTHMSERWVSAALDELIEDVKAVHRRRRGFRGKHTAEYRLRADYVHRSAASRRDSLHSGAASPSESLHPNAATPGDSLHSRSASHPDYLNGSAAFLGRRREEQEEEGEEQQQREVAETDVVRALDELPDELRPQGRAEGVAMAGIVKARLARGWTVEDLVDAAGYRRSDRPIGNRSRVLEHRVPLDPPPPAVLDLRSRPRAAQRPEDDPTWCGHCDHASRRPFDENGYVDTTLPRGSCEACQALSFESHMAAR